MNFSEFLWRLHLYISWSLCTNRKCQKSVLKGSGWLDGSKMTFFGPKLHVFAIKVWFLVQYHKFDDLAVWFSQQQTFSFVKFRKHQISLKCLHFVTSMWLKRTSTWKIIIIFIRYRFSESQLTAERRPTRTPHAPAKIMLIIVANNVVASRPPESQPTGTPHARANDLISIQHSSYTEAHISEGGLIPLIPYLTLESNEY